ncbi:hypothetical protein Forpe1208_v016786 [Fusarium oxysporum f. sp. rapae]|uniref:HNH nuclease domain-containing protein n=1 Tax=Fusarium oxysporum f. sp. rapae TaxID=485398 RepID=A0A8J5NFD9_FUSOX|nr:hypothetical protein Forpe1208_v016786 [Fusarium oxysporum f. sp. rapae]
MASSTVTPSRRSAGWNVVFLAGKSHSHFAGVFSPASCSLLTFQDVVREMSLCFEFQGGSGGDDTGFWGNIAFETLDQDSFHDSFPSLIRDLSISVPSLDSPNLKRPNVLRFRIFRHTPCQLPDDSPLHAHLQAKCAHHLPQPVRRHNMRYLPPKTASSDSRYAIMPYRSTLKGRRGSVSPKRPRSGSTSPNKDTSADPDDMDVSEMVMPANMDLDLGKARKYSNNFRTSCLDNANACAVSGKGASWYFNSDIGPALHACHIVEQKQYHLYPRDDDDQDNEDTMYSPRRLGELWLRTWSSRNSILLLSHLHELFDARLFSIDPKTHKIRAFVPYDVITEYHGRKATLPRDVDPLALQHHYDMCCIENMAAQFPYIDMTSFEDSRMTSGTKTPASTKTDLPATPGSGDPNLTGDPSKKQQLVRRCRDPPSGKNPAADAVGLPPREEDGGGKRKRSDSCELNLECLYNGYSDSYITSLNSREFLADVNWELQRFKATKLS